MKKVVRPITRLHRQLSGLIQASIEENKDNLTIPRHPLAMTSRIAGGVVMKRESAYRYHLNVYHIDDPADDRESIDPDKVIVRTHIRLPRNSKAYINVHPGPLPIEKYEEHLAYAMTAYLPEDIALQALHRQPKTFSAVEPLDELSELQDFVDFTSGYRG